MHEYSIVQALLDQCEDHAKEHNATAVTKVVVKIGKYSGVEPHLLEVAFETFKEKTICSDAEFILTEDDGDDMYLMSLEMESCLTPSRALETGRGQ